MRVDGGEFFGGQGLFSLQLCFLLNAFAPKFLEEVVFVSQHAAQLMTHLVQPNYTVLLQNQQTKHSYNMYIKLACITAYARDDELYTYKCKKIALAGY